MNSDFYAVFGLKCWHCDRIQNPDCGDPFTGDKSKDPSYMDCAPNPAGTNAPTSQPTCLKIKISKLTFELNAFCLEKLTI